MSHPKLALAGVAIVALLGVAIAGCKEDVVSPTTTEPIPAPVGLSWVPASDGAVTITWQPSRCTRVTGYHVYRFTASPNSGMHLDRVTESPICGRSCFCQPDFSEGGDYCVTAVDAAGHESAPSEPICLAPYSPMDHPHRR